MQGQTTWNLEELQANYKKLCEIIERLKVVIKKYEEDNNALRQSWETKNARAYFNEADAVYQEALQKLSEYEQAREEMNRKIQILESMSV